MSSLQAVLRAKSPPGIYRFRSAASLTDLRRQAKVAGWQLYYLDGRRIRDKQTFLKTIARAMSFPSYFGMNWDALNDSITDLQGTGAKGYITLFGAPERFAESSPDDWAVAMDIFKDAIRFWSHLDTPVPFYVLLRGNVPGDFPVLS
jgi:hypothetical protein